MAYDPEMEDKARPVLDRHRARMATVERDPNRKMSMRTKASISQADALLAREGKRLERKRNYWESRTGSEGAASASAAHYEEMPPPASAPSSAAPSSAASSSAHPFRDELSAFSDDDIPPNLDDGSFQIASFTKESDQADATSSDQEEAQQPEAPNDEDMLSMFLPDLLDDRSNNDA